MTALELYKFTEKNEIEWYWYGDEVYYSISFSLLPDFAYLLGSHILECGEVSAKLRSKTIVVKMSYICNHFNIKITEVFEKERAA